MTLIAERLPWEEAPSILAVVRARAGEASSDLPDEPPDDATQPRWAAGALEGVATRHFGGRTSGGASAAELGDQQPDRATQLFDRLKRLVREPGDEERLIIYRCAQSERVFAEVNVVLERLSADPDLIAAVRPHARWLVREARHRGPLKFGIALLGVCGEPEDAETLEILGRHAEFTSYCAIALIRLLADPVDALWGVAKGAEGWGKIGAVERLAPLVGERPEIQRWLLTHGYRNSVMNEYLAYTCATHGRLVDALEGKVDDELLDGACGLIDSLCRGGPAESMYHYADGPLACERLLDRLEERGATLARLIAVIELRRWLEGEGVGQHRRETAEARRMAAEMRAHLEAQGSSGGLFANLRARCRAILAEPHWPETVRKTYERGGDEQWTAWCVARHVGVDLWDAAFERLRSGPPNARLVDPLVRAAPLERRRRIVAWAEQNLALERIASGPKLGMLGTPGQQEEESLHSVVQAMSTRELYSESLVAAALVSPVTVTRVTALEALKAQPRGSWGPAVEAALERLRHEEPSVGVRERLLALIG